MYKKDDVSDRTIPWVLSSALVVLFLLFLSGMAYLGRDIIIAWLDPTASIGMTVSTERFCPQVPVGWDNAITEEFTDNANRWSTGVWDYDVYSSVNVQIQDNLFQWNITADQGTYYSERPYANATTRDFYVSTLARKVSGPADAEYGLVFRILGDQMLFFAIQDSGEVTVHVRNVNLDWEVPLFGAHTDHVHVGENNRLVILARDDHYIFCVNQVPVGNVHDSNFPLGQFGLGVKLNASGDEAVFEFDDFVVYIPPKPK